MEINSKMENQATPGKTLPGNGRFSNQWSGCGKELPEQGGIRKNRPKWDGQTRRVTAKPSRRKNPYLPQGKKKLNPKKGEKRTKGRSTKQKLQEGQSPPWAKPHSCPNSSPKKGENDKPGERPRRKFHPERKKGGKNSPLKTKLWQIPEC